MLCLMARSTVPRTCWKIYTCKAREAIISIKHPAFDELKMHNVSPKLSEMPGKVKWCGPELGQHNDEIYRDLLKMEKKQIAELTDKDII